MEASRYKCDICGKTKLSNRELQSHLRVHNEEKLFSCEICNKAFPRVGRLKEHIKTHTGEKPLLVIYATKHLL